MTRYKDEIEADMDWIAPRINDAVRRMKYGEAADYARDFVTFYEEWVRGTEYRAPLMKER